MTFGSFYPRPPGRRSETAERLDSMECTAADRVSAALGFSVFADFVAEDQCTADEESTVLDLCGDAESG